ncbi:hypothetical protein, conserved [Leishmania donovani]|uniref:Uncharacterized protein n=1 Tax=Leishmania donovani TaxID=5661 RepID=E9BDW0_LEIDO|nr:hypothetical protein, conserved [Leishmania donovani]CBZ33436.1 hypothetical protein, conserved [Leishmania donovani]
MVPAAVPGRGVGGRVALDLVLYGSDMGTAYEHRRKVTFLPLFGSLTRILALIAASSPSLCHRSHEGTRADDAGVVRTSRRARDNTPLRITRSPPPPVHLHCNNDLLANSDAARRVDRRF